MKITELMEKRDPRIPAGMEQQPGAAGQLYHYTSVEGAKGILRSGAIDASGAPQDATRAQTNLPTVSVTRKWQYATGQDSGVVKGGGGAKKTHDVIFILDRQRIENNYKTIGTSQGVDHRGSAMGHARGKSSHTDPERAKDQQERRRKAHSDEITRYTPGGEEYSKVDTNNDGNITPDEKTAHLSTKTGANVGPDSDSAIDARLVQIDTYKDVGGINPKHKRASGKYADYSKPGDQKDWVSPGEWKAGKTGHEFEEVIPVKSGKLPIRNIVAGIYLNSDAAKNDPELRDLIAARP